LLTVSRRFMNVTSSVLWRMAIILKTNKGNLFVSSVVFVFWSNSPTFLDTPRIYIYIYMCVCVCLCVCVQMIITINSHYFPKQY
jgi:hypothetical protein